MCCFLPTLDSQWTQGQGTEQKGIWHQSENPSLHCSLDGSCLRGKLGLFDRPSLSCVEDSDALDGLTWQWDGFSGLDQRSHHHLLLLQRDGPIEVTLLPIHTPGKQPHPQGKGQNEAKGTGFFPPRGWGWMGERMVPSVCISIKDDLWRRENLETYTYNGNCERQIQWKSTWLCYMPAVWPLACYLSSLWLDVLIGKMGVCDKISISFFVWENLHYYKI